MGKYLIILVPFLLNVIRSVETIETYNGEEYCDGTIRDNGAIIVFDASKLRTDLYGNRCQINIAPSGDYSRIFFYFEQFELSSYRSEENMTMTEGGYRNQHIEGLAEYMYGVNTTLVRVGQNFTTSGQDLKITYYCNTDYGARPSGKFRLIYLRLTTDTNCDSDDEHKCPNGNCVDKKYYCSSEIRACTTEDLACETLEVLENVIDLIVNIIKNVGWIIFLLIVFVILKSLFRRYRDHICNFFFKRGTNVNRSTELEQRNNAERLSLQLDEVEENTHNAPDVTEETETHSDYRYHSDEPFTSSTVPGDNVSHTSTTSVDFPTQHNPVLPSAPPPSYDSVMAPSYDEVMSNQEKYKHSGP